jgi:leucyl aminopeptidase
MLSKSSSTKQINRVLTGIIQQPISTELEKILATMTSGFVTGKVTEAVITIELQHPAKYYMNFIFLCYDTSIIKDKSAYKFLESLREIGGHICHALRKNELRNFNLYIHRKAGTALTLVQRYLLCILEGFLLAMYSFDKYKTQLDTTTKAGKQIPRFQDQVLNTVADTKLIKAKLAGLLSGGAGVSKKRRSPIKYLSNNPNNYAVNIILLDGSRPEISSTMAEINRLVIIMKSVYMARDLINEPGNILTTRAMGQMITGLKTNYKLPLEIEILGRDACKKLGMGLLVAVGDGSDVDRQSGLVILKYNGAGKAKSIKSFCLIGKGITQDTGGYSLKDTSDILEMKSDKSGASIVLATIICCARLQLPVNIVAMLPLAQNSIGPGSMVPGDIVTAYNGLTVEISDPDAEGRLILADCIAYAVDKWPDYQIIDMATLTFEQEAVSCKKFSTLIEVNSSDMADKLVIAGEIEGERVVKMPFIPDFDEAIESDIADLKNTASTCQGDIYPSAMFMSSFLKPKSRWIHIDLGGNTFKVDSPYLEEGSLASGVGVKLLMNIMLDAGSNK